MWYFGGKYLWEVFSSLSISRSIMKLSNRNNPISLITYIYSIDILKHSSRSHWCWGFEDQVEYTELELMVYVDKRFYSSWQNKYKYCLHRQWSFDLVYHGVRQDVVEEWGEVPVLHCWVNLTDFRIHARCFKVS